VRLDGFGKGDLAMDTAALVRDQLSRYPQLQLQDLFKALYQSVFGGGHLITDPDEATRRIREELKTCRSSSGPAQEPLGGSFCRLHLAPLKGSGLRPETLSNLFLLSAAGDAGDRPELEARLNELLALINTGETPFCPAEASSAICSWRDRGYPALHHSDAFRAAYSPAYRVLRTEHARLLPLLIAVDRMMAEKGRVILAIEGGSASGKTTLAALLSRLYAAEVFHMDDFYLRVEQRTPARYAEPGGNVDRERFLSEVLQPLRDGREFLYRPFDVETWTVSGGSVRCGAALNIVEGAYSMHPDLAPYYDLSVFLDVSPTLQRRRIRQRNTPESQVLFFSRWIPLEQSYFSALDPKSRCDLVLNVESSMDRTPAACV